MTDTSDFRDRQDTAAPVAQPAEVDNEIQGTGNLSLNGLQRQVGTAERHGLEPRQHIGRGICVPG